MPLLNKTSSGSQSVCVLILCGQKTCAWKVAKFTIAPEHAYGAEPHASLESRAGMKASCVVCEPVQGMLGLHPRSPRRWAGDFSRASSNGDLLHSSLAQAALVFEVELLDFTNKAFLFMQSAHKLVPGHCEEDLFADGGVMKVMVKEGSGWKAWRYVLKRSMLT